MEALYSFGGVLVNRDELMRAANKGSLYDFARAMRGGTGSEALSFGATSPAASMSAAASFAATLPAGGASDVQANQPLTIRIARFYVGRFGDRDIGNLFGDRDAILCSLYRGFAETAAAPRNLHFVAQNLPTRGNIQIADLSQPGTDIVFTTPALAHEELDVQVEANFNQFRSDLIQTVSQALGSAAGIPVFAAASTYLLVASIVTKVTAGLLKVLDAEPELQGVVRLSTFDVAIAEPVQLPYILIANPALAVQANRTYKLDGTGLLVDSGGKAYQGDEPYAVLQVDTRPHPTLKDFKSALVSAQLLDKFYNLKDGSPVSALGVLLDGAKAYNDFNYRDDAKKYKTFRDGAQAGSDDYKHFDALYQAAKKNILDVDLAGTV